MQKITGAIFDLDGLLTNTEWLNREAWNNALRPHGVRLHKSDYSDLVGKSGMSIAEECVNKYNLSVAPAELWSEKGRQLAILNSTMGNIELMPYALETVRLFHTHGVSLAVASGATRRQVDSKLQQTGLSKYFRFALAREDVEKPKPAPDIYRLAVAKFCLPASECIAFEDTLCGVTAAKAAGLVCLAIPTELSEQQNFSIADGRFANLRDAAIHASKHYVF